MRRKVAFHTLGCKLNFSETSTIRRQFEEQLFDVTDFDQTADVYVINTCSVTQDANRDCRKAVRKALRLNPNAYIAVTGCYAQLEPEEIASIEGVDAVIGAKAKLLFFQELNDFKKSGEPVIYHTDVNEAAEFHHAFSASDRTRAFLKVQDGCDYKCSFCTIPLARGQSRSPKIETIVRSACILVNEGYKEIVVTGVNAGDFGKQHGERFHDLLQALDTIDGLERIRISSIEPNLLEHRTIDFIAGSRSIQPHFHMPIQSGSNEMLHLMRRRYKSELYSDKVSHIKAVLPHACIGVDVITGHPGEINALFDASFDFLQALDVSYLHVFTYSERPKTHALEIEPSIPIPIRKQRTHKLKRLSDIKRTAFDLSHKGTTRAVLFESEEKDGLLYGWTDNYIRVGVPYSESLMNRIKAVPLNEYNTDHNFYFSTVLQEVTA